jgi:rhamnopyranosyl-N-acetylglucosaminyl-diphospho-decaprenol beta-1,3/1,4-galactofuranosyltransferase
VSERVCAVVVTHDRKSLLEVCLAALLDQARPPDATLVVDNASRDGTPELLARRFPRVRSLRLPRNEGGAGGFAEGMEWALGRGFEWIWLMDDDVAPDRGCLRELLEVAAESRRSVVVPRRVRTDGADCGSEAVLVETAQRFDPIRADPERHRHHAIDLFTFEGPLVHRSVAGRVGVPNRRLFICGDDILYAIRINRAMGPLASVLATRAVVRKQLAPRTGIAATSRLKGWLTGDPAYDLLPDDQHWKAAYEHRNRHLIWRALGWRRRRLQLLVLHPGYVAADLLHAVRHGWNWSLRLRWNVAAWLLGALARDGVFLDPDRYLARVAAARRSVRKGSP